MSLIKVHVLLVFALDLLIIFEAVHLHLLYAIIVAIGLHSFYLSDLFLDHSLALNRDKCTVEKSLLSINC